MKAVKVPPSQNSGEKRVIPRRWAVVGDRTGEVIIETSDPTVVAAWRTRYKKVSRVCGCGCKTVIDHMNESAVCVDAAHRARAWKDLTGYGRPTSRKGRANARPRAKRKTKTIEVDAKLHADLSFAAKEQGETLREYVERKLRAGIVTSP